MLQHSDQLDAIYHALADGGRRAMIERLSRGPASVSELAEPLDMTLSAVVQHLKVLEASGLVRTEKVGRVRTCHVDSCPVGIATQSPDLREKFVEFLGDLLLFGKRRQSNLMLFN